MLNFSLKLHFDFEIPMDLLNFVLKLQKWFEF